MFLQIQMESKWKVINYSWLLYAVCTQIFV